jgi:hypothetical protein
MATSMRDCQLSRYCSEANACYLNYEEGICDRGTRDANRDLKIAGLVFVGIGSAGVAAGLVLSAMGALLCQLNSDEDASCVPFLGLTILSAGAAVTLGVGMPMAIVGNRDVPREDRMAPAAVLAPRGVTLRWSF